MRVTARSIGNVLAVVALLFLLNLGWVALFDRPILYCWLPDTALIQFLASYQQIAIVVLAAAIAIAAARRRGGQAAVLFAVAILVAGVPGFFETLFNVGGSCGA